jgi:hypothetical protein
MSAAIHVARVIATRSPTWLYRRLPDRLRLWCADVRVRHYVERGSW